jgi:hypothetical protein
MITNGFRAEYSRCRYLQHMGATQAGTGSQGTHLSNMWGECWCWSSRPPPRAQRDCKHPLFAGLVRAPSKVSVLCSSSSRVEIRPAAVSTSTAAIAAAAGGGRGHPGPCCRLVVTCVLAVMGGATTLGTRAAAQIRTASVRCARVVLGGWIQRERSLEHKGVWWVGGEGGIESSQH